MGSSSGQVRTLGDLRATEQVDAVAKLDFALVQSLGILWLLAPDRLPSGDELARAVAVIAGVEPPAADSSVSPAG